jgi:uncharacterized protein (UPF0335 family)
MEQTASIWPYITQIAVAVLGVIGTIDLVRLLFLKEDKKGKQIENVDKDVEVAKHANELLSAQLERSHETIARKDEQIDKLQEDIAELKAAQSCLFDDMCIHKGCRIRKPHQGQGGEWYKRYREDPNLGADYTSIDTLLKMDRASRKRAVDDAELESAEADCEQEQAGGTEA